MDPILVCLNLDIFGVLFDRKLTFAAHVHDIVSRDFQTIGIAISVFDGTIMLLQLLFAFDLHILSTVLLSGIQLLTVTFSFLSARCILWPGFGQMKFFHFWIIDAWLCLLYMVYYDSVHCLYCEQPFSSLRFRHARAAVLPQRYMSWRSIKLPYIPI